MRPSELAAHLGHLGAVSVGAAGTLIIRETVGRTQLRKEIASRLPFPAAICICDGREIIRLIARAPFTERRTPAGATRFVSILARHPRAVPPMPMRIPPAGPWLVKVIALDAPFVLGFYKPHLRVISYLGSLDRKFGVPVTTRSWSTVTRIAALLKQA